MDEEVKACPYCAETIKAEAIKCKHCGTSLLTGTINSEPTKLARKPIWPWFIFVPLALFGLLLLIGALSGPPTEKDRDRLAIDLCWKDFDDPLASLQTKTFVRGACRGMVDKFEATYGRSASLRRD
ncbi:hypothetical protein VP719_21020 [Pseudomonas protegens]|uniref:zinc ribbon domain-containing protein n=1 Tax=Pseudomonas protegens TaxID=380021 RepID=UPI002DBCB884|nr:hypothetical protein [Pseudomonas protegens]WRV89416.1 hypothetical protein VP719_21020 [Pseudomonas protegens]